MTSLRQQYLSEVPHAFVGLAQVDAQGQVSLQTTGELKPEQPLPLGRLGELLGALLLLQAIEQGKFQLDEPVNYHLQKLRLLSPTDITLRQLLTRSSGLGLRESALYVDDPKRTLPLSELLPQDLKPAVMAADRALVPHSLGDLLPAELVRQQAQQPLPELLSERLLEPLKLTTTRPVSGPPALSAGGHDAQGLPFPPLWASAELHNYQTSLQDLGKLLQALLSSQPPVTPAMRQLLVSPHLIQGQRFSSLGLRETQLQGQRLLYLDSDWFGYQLRFALLPEANQGFVLVYNSADPAFKRAITPQLLSEVNPSAQQQALATADDIASAVSLVAVREQNSLLKVLNLFELRGPQAWLQGLIALLLTLLLASVFWRAAHFLWAYEPQLEPDATDISSVSSSEPEATEADTAGVEASELPAAEGAEALSPVAGWDIPLLAGLGSGLGLLFTLGFYPVLFGLGRVGEQLSWVVRNAPSPWLIVWLALPLLALVSVLMLVLLLLSEWKSRPWVRGERLHLLVYIVGMLGWASWLAHWNLLGFKF